MNKEQMIEIALAGFPEHTHKDIEGLEFFSWSGVHRLYDPTEGFILILPKSTYMAVILHELEPFAQISVGHKAFNHYAGIQKMISLNLINGIE